ncbi:MAG: low specificity L-threonine aldolase [Actinobacteria bacterium]|nr:low specificity L-threonine aldolase [Actinomycetota bacterium]
MPSPIELRSDNAAGAAPQLLNALAAANTGSALAYGGDAWTEELREVVAEAFGAPDVAVFPVSSGTAANSLALSAMCPPWGSVLCHETAHIITNEGGATSMFGAGAVMQGLSGERYKLTPKTVKTALDAAQWGDPHCSQPSVVSFTCPTDFGTVYSPDEVSAVVAVARARGLKTHLDGARLANAIAGLHCSPAALTREAGIDVFSLGAIKGGAISTDAIVSFDPEVSDQLLYRVKRAGHVSSKMRFQSAQLIAYLSDGLWVKMARTANAATAELARGLRERDVALLAEPQANIIFAKLGDKVAAALADLDVYFYSMGGGVVRFVTSWQTTPHDITDMLGRLDQALTVRRTAPRTVRPRKGRSASVPLPDVLDGLDT